MKTRIKVIIAIASCIAIVVLIIVLVSCNKKAAPDISSFSTANQEETEVTTESVTESVPSDHSDEPDPSNALQTEESTSEPAYTTRNSEAEQTAQQTSQTTRETKPTNERPQTQATVTPKPTSATVPTNTPTPKPTSTPKPTATPKPEPTATPVPTNTPTPEPTATPKPTNTPKPTPKPVNDPKYTKCIADVEYWAGPDNCYHGIVYGVPCVRNSAGKWETTGKGEDMVWDAIEAEHPDAGGYTDKIVSGSHRNFS